jgi:predicted DNA-binding transcriptional regulator AlpA
VTEASTMTQGIDPNTLVDKRRLAELLNVSQRTVERLVESEELPAPFKTGRKAYWTGKTLLAHFNRMQSDADC